MPHVLGSKAKASETTGQPRTVASNGYSPEQHALGRAPDEHGRFHAAGPDVVPEVLGELPNPILPRSSNS